MSSQKHHMYQVELQTNKQKNWKTICRFWRMFIMKNLQEKSLDGNTP
jgi:hypothetical protein